MPATGTMINNKAEGEVAEKQPIKVFVHDNEFDIDMVLTRRSHGRNKMKSLGGKDEEGCHSEGSSERKLPLA